MHPMKDTAIIAEYNPFHNGHKYHIEKIRQLTDADFCLVIMSGNFTQRGEPAIIDKYIRTNMALANGADLVLELPVCFSCASSPYFAQGAISILEQLGTVDYLAFGSECGQISILENTASILTQNPPAYAKALKDGLKTGLTFPAAQSQALAQYDQKFSHVLTSPNNLLGVEYCKCLLSRNSTIKPITILRTGRNYNDSILQGTFGSALAIRTALEAQTSLESIRPCVPDNVLTIMKTFYLKRFPVFPDMLSQMLHYRLLIQSDSGFTSYLDITEDLSHRICRQIPSYENFHSFCMLLKTKEITYTRISRSLLHILLDIRKEDPVYDGQEKEALYARILGFRQTAVPLLTAIRANSQIPLISKLADAHKYLKEPALRRLTKDIQAAHLYNALIYHAYGTKLPGEMQQQILRVSPQ